LDEDPDAREDIPGVLIVRIRESLDFGMFPVSFKFFAKLIISISHIANTGKIKDRLRRLELYGPTKVHPSEAPRRQHANVVVFHMADVEKIDAS